MILCSPLSTDLIMYVRIDTFRRHLVHAVNQIKDVPFLPSPCFWSSSLCCVYPIPHFLGREITKIFLLKTLKKKLHILECLLIRFYAYRVCTIYFSPSCDISEEEHYALLWNNDDMRRGYLAPVEVALFSSLASQLKRRLACITCNG